MNIVVNETEPTKRIRLLGHLDSPKSAAYRKSRPNRPIIEVEADFFASRLLAPTCILWGLHLQNPEEIACFCNISRQAAVIRAREMKEVYKNGTVQWTDEEKRLLDKFKPWISKAWEVLPYLTTFRYQNQTPRIYAG